MIVDVISSFNSYVGCVLIIGKTHVREVCCGIIVASFAVTGPSRAPAWAYHIIDTCRVNCDCSTCVWGVLCAFQAARISWLGIQPASWCCIARQMETGAWWHWCSHHSWTAERWTVNDTHLWLVLLPSDGSIWALMIVWRLGGKIIRTVLCCIVYDSCAQWYTHTHVCEQF